MSRLRWLSESFPGLWAYSKVLCCNEGCWICLGMQQVCTVMYANVLFYCGKLNFSVENERLILSPDPFYGEISDIDAPHVGI